MDFYWTKGIAALVAVLLLLWHMRGVKRESVYLGQWLRYLTLLYFAVLLTGAAVDQVHSDAVVSWYNVGGLVGALVLIVAMVVSIAEERRDPR